MRARPLHDRVLVKRIGEKETACTEAADRTEDRRALTAPDDRASKRVITPGSERTGLSAAWVSHHAREGWRRGGDRKRVRTRRHLRFRLLEQSGCRQTPSALPRGPAMAPTARSTGLSYATRGLDSFHGSGSRFSS